MFKYLGRNALHLSAQTSDIANTKFLSRNYFTSKCSRTLFPERDRIILPTPRHILVRCAEYSESESVQLSYGVAWVRGGIRLCPPVSLRVSGATKRLRERPEQAHLIRKIYRKDFFSFKVSCVVVAILNRFWNDRLFRYQLLANWVAMKSLIRRWDDHKTLARSRSR